MVFFGEIFLPKIHEVRVKRGERERGEGQMSFWRKELCFFGRRTKFYDGFKAGSKNERTKRGRLGEVLTLPLGDNELQSFF